MSLFLHHDALSAPLENPRLRVLSLGVGVQSVTLYRMAERGDLGPKPDVAIVADTKAEPKWFYDYLAHLQETGTIPIVVVSAGDLEADILQGQNTTSHDWCAIPAFALNEDAETGMLRRQCTQEYKIHAIQAEIRRLLGLKPRQSIRHFLKLKRGEPTPLIVETWVGISMDEITRMKSSRLPYEYKRHPLIEARMSRKDCLRWLEERQYRLPRKSACVFCPYRDHAKWLDLKENAPEDFARAVAVDRAIRNGNPSIGMRTGKMGVHRSLTPLEDVDFTQPDPADGFRFGWANECEGMCGV